MRPLTLLVLAEFLVLVLLTVLLLSGTTAAAGGVSPPPATAPPEPAAAEVAPGPAPGAAPVEREAAAPAVPELAAGDALGILVTGNIRSTDGTPVDGASVYYRRDREYHSGDAAAPGVYAVAGLQPGEWQLTCRAEGFGNHEASCTLDARAFQQIDIELTPSYVVRVKVQGADGKSIMGDLAKQAMFGMPYVVATETPLAGDLPITEQTRLLRFGLGEWVGFYEMGQNADAKLREQGWCGELRLGRAPPVAASLLLRSSLLRSQRIEPGQKELVFTLELDDVLAKFGTVKLRLLDGVTGAPIAGAGVRVSTAQGGGSFGKTGEDGRTVIERVLPGLGCLELMQSKEHESLWRYVRVPSGGVADLGDVTLSAMVKITGVVVDADGKPANGAEVQWTELDCRTFPQPLVSRRSASAEADGKFELWGCGRHRYVVSSRPRAGGFGWATVDASGGAPPPVTITLATPSKVTLHATFDLTAGYVVTALAADRSPVAVATLGSEYRPESMSLPPGAYTIEIHDMQTDRLVRSFALQVGSEPLTIDVP
ncbi:MAG TPA: carboxypeptidase-like regulatory domain-containing protein [Planctomycetota bacterium]|nr:carboxypeptidase-like regulatory domain-containing protein [Planctomycetota bacterium]